MEAIQAPTRKEVSGLLNLSEAVALGMAIEAMEKPAALARKTAGQDAGRESRWDGSGSLDPEPKAALHPVRSRDIAAQAVDMSPATYERITQVITVIQVLELLQPAVCPGRARAEDSSGSAGE